MKLPSIEYIMQASSRTFLRFPVVIVDALIGTAAALVLVENEASNEPTIFHQVLLAAILGIPFLATLTLVGERKRWTRPVQVGAIFVGVLLLALYAITVPTNLSDAPAMHMIRFALLAAAVLLFSAFVPFGGRGEINGFWHYNRVVVLRVVTAALFSGVLFAGLAIALAALDNLFGVEVDPKRYFELWICVAGIFAPWFILAGIPEDLGALDASTDYPKVVKIFAQYILIPLVLVYLVILYAYVGKILFEWSWPRGWVGGLIFGYGVAGIVMLLLLHPVRDRQENVWIKSASRWFFVSMIPLVVILLLAIYRRVSEYGLTESRYLGVVLAIWFAAMILYFLLSSAKSIKVIPASLFVVALLASFGPWGAFQVSESNQVGRLRDVLEKHSLLADGRVKKTETALPLDDARRISSVIRYLHEVHGYGRIQPWFAESLVDDSTGTGRRGMTPELVTRIMGVEYVSPWMEDTEGFVHFQADADGVTDVAGYDRMIQGQFVTAAAYKSFPEEGVSYRVNSTLDTLTFVAASSGPAGASADSLAIALEPMVATLLTGHAGTGPRNIDPGNMTVESVAPSGFCVKLCLSNISIQRKEGKPGIMSYQADILYARGRTSESR